MPEETKETPAQTSRLCSEIQLFDLCDLESCRFKSSRFCTNEELLDKFEAIKEEDDRNNLVYEDEDSDMESEDADFDDPDEVYEEDES